MNTEWLSTLCDPEEIEIRPICQKPYGITVDSIRWAFVTNGKVFCAIKEASGYPDFEFDIKSTHETIIEMLTHDGDYQIATLDSLRQWAGDPLPSCSTCNSTGTVNCPSSCNGGCQRCDHEGFIFCPDCKGESLPYYKPAYGLINNVLINRKLIATAFHHLDRGQVRVLTSGEDCMAYFISSNWRVSVMPVSGSAERNAKEIDQAVQFNEWSNLAHAG